jgi:hypothetical protein
MFYEFVKINECFKPFELYMSSDLILYTTRLGKKGAIVTGINFSARSIESARDIAARKPSNSS